jgi:hypothetical protein
MKNPQNTKTGAAGNDPTPWRHVDGARVADIYAPESPVGGYTFDPRPDYADHANRYISTSNGGRS